MINEIQNYVIPVSDIIYRNKDQQHWTPVDSVQFKEYAKAFLIGRRILHKEDLMNFYDGHAIYMRYLLGEKAAKPEMADSVDNELKEAVSKAIKLWDIFHSYDQPTDPAIMQITEAEITEIRNKIIIKNGNGEVLSIKYQKLGTILRMQYKFVYISETKEFLIYDAVSGYFKSGARDFIAQKVREVLGEESTVYHVNEIISFIRDLSRVEGEFTQPDNLINMANGVYDWKSRKLLPHSPDYHFKNVLPFPYNKHVRYSPFFDFLEQVTLDDPEKALVLLESIAWVFIGGYPIQKAIALFGAGNNGKSVFLNFLTAFIGRDNISSIPLQTLCNNKFAVPGLIGKLANISGDVGNAALTDTSVFKALTGDDSQMDSEIKGIQARPQFKNRAKLFFAFNRFPSSSDNSRAYFRRFIIPEFVQDFTGREDKELTRKLTRTEDLQAVFNLVSDVFLPVLNTKLEFYNQESTEKTMARYRLNSDPALAFIDEKLEPDPNSQIPINTLYNRFVQWCKSKGVSSVSPEAFGRSVLKNEELLVSRRQIQKDNVRVTFYIGIKIKDEVDLNEEHQKDGNIKGKVKNLNEAIDLYINKHRGILSPIGTIGTIVFLNLKKRLKNNNTYNKNFGKSIVPIADSFEQPNNNQNARKEIIHYVLLAILEDINLAGIDGKDYYLHRGDIAHIPNDSAKLLVERGRAREIEEGAAQ